MSKSFSERSRKSFGERQVSKSGKGRQEFMKKDVIEVPTGEETQELFGNPDDLIVMSEIPPSLILPLARMRQIQNELGKTRFEELHGSNVIIKDDAVMERMLEEYVLEEASK